MEQFYAASIKNLEPQVLRQWLITSHDQDDKKKLAIIDVRDSDYRYGHIKSSVNYPSKAFMNESIVQLLNRFPLDQGYTYVFHCMRSQIRGPRCAKKFIRFVFLNTEVKDDYTKCPNVYLLKGGLKEWNRLYGDDRDLMVPI